MKGQRTFNPITTIVRDLIYSLGFLEYARQRPEDFTRNRKMPFTDLLLFMINLVRGSTQIALNRFFQTKGSEIEMTQQSFSEARKKLRWEACRALMDTVVKAYYQLTEYIRWRGYRVLAVDGSKQQLPSDSELRILYGTAGRGDTAVTAQGSALFDVLNDIIIDARLEPMSTDERSLAYQHMEYLRSLPSFSRELVLFDRGYASFDLIQSMANGAKPITFVFRLRSKFRTDIDKLPIGDHRYTLKNGEDSCALRVVKFKLDSGETETLITNLFDRDLTTKDFKELYFMRWPIETKFAELKHKLEIENFSGRTQLAILQDFFITAFLSNMIAIAAEDAQMDADAERQDKDNKYQYKINVNQAVGNFKDRYIMALLESNRRKRTKMCDEILNLLVRSVIPERPDRSTPRNPSPRRAHFFHNKKSNC